MNREIKFEYKFVKGEYHAIASYSVDKENECLFVERWHRCEEEFKKGNLEKFKKSDDYKSLVKRFKERALSEIKIKVEEYKKSLEKENKEEWNVMGIKWNVK